MRSSPRRGDRRCDPRWTRSSDPDDDVDVSRRSRIAKRDERNRFDRVDVIASEFDADFVRGMLPKIDWTAFSGGARDIAKALLAAATAAPASFSSPATTSEL